MKKIGLLFLRIILDIVDTGVRRSAKRPCGEWSVAGLHSGNGASGVKIK
jgi:hypothetical protein